MSQHSTKACRVLVVEDEPLIAMVIEAALETIGCEIVGPVAKLDEAIDLANRASFDCAILDVNIRGGHVYPVADLLMKRGLPILLASGYGEWTLPAHLLGEKRLEKPYTSEQLEVEIRLLCARVRKGAESPL
jgi:DNA-binding response OmpR family regulator